MCFRQSEMTHILKCVRWTLGDLKYIATGWSVACEFSQWKPQTTSLATNE